jgi:hypothetical protein
MSGFRACCTTRDCTRCPVAPRIRRRRVPCSMTARTQAFVPLSRPAVKKSSARISCAWDRRNSAQPGPFRRGAGLMPASLRIGQTVDAATVMPGPASSPWIRGIPTTHSPGPAAAPLSATLRCVAGRPERPRRDRRARRRRTMSRCQRKIVPGVTVNRIAARRSARHRPRKQRQPRPVRPRPTRMSTRPLARRHSELIAQHEDLGVLPSPLPPRQAQQRYGTGGDQEDQLHPRKPKIIPRPGRRPAG